jgi:hypothetical protein
LRCARLWDAGHFKAYEVLVTFFKRTSRSSPLRALHLRSAGCAVIDEIKENRNAN